MSRLYIEDRIAFLITLKKMVYTSMSIETFAVYVKWHN